MTISTPLPQLDPQYGDALVSRVWVQVTALVLLFGLAILGFLGFRAYTADPPIASEVRTAAGDVVYTGDDVRAGQAVFLREGLMEYGSIFGHGAYLGPDFTADYLHRAALIATREYTSEGSGVARDQVIADFKTNRYDPSSDTVTYTDVQARAFAEMVTHYTAYFGPESASKGLLPEAITDPGEIKQLTAYFAWSAWAGATLRPDKDYTYTNNWPPESLVDNAVTANVVVWSVLSLIALLAGIGALFAAFGRWGERLGWRGRQADTISFRAPGDVAVTPTQRACAYFFLVVGLLFVIQTMVGAASEHYRADLTSFFGFDLARWLPYNLVRTWHVQLAIFWTATSFLATGLFLAPIVSGREPRRQSLLAYGLLGALAVVVFGSMIGELLDIHGWLPSDLHLFGMQGWEYLDLGRFWQVLLTIGLFFWAFMLFRGLRGALHETVPDQPALVVLLHRVGDPGVLRGGPAHQLGVQLHGRRLLAVHGRPSVGGGLPRDLHHGPGGLPVRPARCGAPEGRDDDHLPRHHPVLARWCRRHDAPPVLLRHSGRDDGARRLLLGRGGVAVDVPHRRGLVVPAARVPAGGVVRRRRSRTGGR